MGYPQPPTVIQVDDNTSNSFAKKILKQKRSKAIDIRFYWMQGRCSQRQLKKIGYQEQPILVIITPSAIPLLTTYSYATNTFTWKT